MDRLAAEVMNKLRQNFIIIQLYTRSDAARLNAGEILVKAAEADEDELEAEKIAGEEKPAKKSKPNGEVEEDIPVSERSELFR